MNAKNYVSKYKNKASTGFSAYDKIKATEKWVEYQLDVYDMSNLIMKTNDFTTKVDLIDAIAIAERKRDYMYGHPNFDLQKATRWFRLVKDSPKIA